MTWGMVAGAAIGLVGSAVASGNAADAANSATEAQSAAAGGQLQLGKDQLDFNKQVYADGTPARVAAQGTAQKAAESQLAGMDFATDQAKKDQAYREGTFQPLEKGVVADAQAYDTPEKEAAAAQSAQSDVNRAASAGNAALERDLGRSGVAPGSAKAMSLMQDATINQAAASAGAGTTAARNVQQQGYARKMDAASLGRNLPANQATQQSIGTTAGTAAVGSTMQGVLAQQSGVNNVNAGYAGAVSAGNSAGNLFGNAAGTYNTINNANMAGIGQLGKAVGSAVTAWNTAPPSTYDPTGGTGDFARMDRQVSDKNVKSGTGHMVNAAKALKQIEDTPVHDGWRYDPAKGGPNDGGKPHVGPMAQRVRQTMGEAAAPGGKEIDLVNMNGRVLAGMQALAQRMKKLESQQRSK